MSKGRPIGGDRPAQTVQKALRQDRKRHWEEVGDGQGGPAERVSPGPNSGRRKDVVKKCPVQGGWNLPNGWGDHLSEE